MPYLIPTDHERRAVFAYLKQASSLTAWRRLYMFHQVFVDAVRTAHEDEQNTPGRELTIATERYADILGSQRAFKVALDRLASGDRRCFAFLGAAGHFSEGIRTVKWWQDMYRGSFSGRNGFKPADSPHWPAIELAMHDCLAALSDIGSVLQDRVMQAPAAISTLQYRLTYPEASLLKHWVSQPTLPPVPSVLPEVLVPTGQVIPCYGIWEPVRVDRHSGKGITPAGVPYELGETWDVDGRPLDGPMNYLHGDFEAPPIAFQGDLPCGDEGRPTTWRLVWSDDRYGAESIPEEESHYAFIRPVPGEVLFRYG